MLGPFGGAHEEEENKGTTSAAAAAAAAAVGATPTVAPPTTVTELMVRQRQPHPRPGSDPASQLRQILINCAQMVARSDYHSAAPLLSFLSTSSSPLGDSTDRLISQFAKALSFRLHRHQQYGHQQQQHGPVDDDPQVLQSSFLSLNQITPFIRFGHLTANQAILEAVEGHDSVHILDFDTMQGVQWPPLMQAMAERSKGNPPAIRITGTGSDLDTLLRTGSRLETFALSLGLRFRFRPYLVRRLSDLANLPASLDLLPDEALAVNCVLHLHKLLRGWGGVDPSADLTLVLRALKSMNPKVLTLAEREARHNHPVFLRRFGEALEHYSALFESLEATLPPSSQERVAVEQVWFGREIADIVSAEEEERRERHERFERWAEIMKAAGFSNMPLSAFAFSQARALLRLHYPSEGYQLQLFNDSFFLGWQSRPLFSVSSWH
ncbi:Scarecrow-like protein 18 [Nymphaea thermarum]|nr:Scarecrow-like protein 18 [Nymphaea thermarum]